MPEQLMNTNKPNAFEQREVGVSRAIPSRSSTRLAFSSILAGILLTILILFSQPMLKKLFDEFDLKVPSLTLLFGLRITPMGILLVTGFTTFINILPLPTLAVDRLNKVHLALIIVVLSLYVYAMCLPLMELYTNFIKHNN